MAIVQDLARQAAAMLEEQKISWDTLRENSAAFAKMETKVFTFEHGARSFRVICQFNPARIYSVSAKVDANSVKARPCFLCDLNRPAAQRSLLCGNGYKLLCNPFPILPAHFTLVNEAHEPQKIRPHIGAMLDLTAALGEKYSVFYNGPECGASAPDHMHFQAGTKNYLPADEEYDRLKTRVALRNDVEIFVVENYLRRVIALESSNRSALLESFAKLHDALHAMQPGAVEAKMNVLCSRQGDRWRLILFPRSAHRPAMYYAADENQRMMISPGSVDICGVIVMPIERDFRRVTAQHLAQTYQEVTVSADVFAELIACISK